MKNVNIRRWIFAAIIAAVLLWAGAGLVLVRKNEIAYKQAGSTDDTRVLLGPGVHWSAPFLTDVEKRLLTDTKVVVIGIDGADWELINHFIRRGYLPNIARLVRDGVHGKLKSIEPLLSPLIWTSIITGKSPDKHGIIDFMVVDTATGREIPATSNMRRVNTLWQIAGDLGKSVGSVGWLATWPAEKVNGFIVSDRVGHLAYDLTTARHDNIAYKTYPERLLTEVDGSTRKPASVKWEELNRFIDVSSNEFVESQSSNFEPENPINNLRLVYASAETYRNIGLRLKQQYAPDLFTVYFELLDSVKHLFVRHMPPRMPDIDEEEFKKYRRAICEAYRYQDEIIGDYLRETDTNTTVFILSDHGFKSGVARLTSGSEIGAGHAAEWHRPYGVLIAWGKNIRQGVRINGASVLDICPTILYLLGYPVAHDMDGKVLTEALTTECRQARPLDYIATYEKDAVSIRPSPAISSPDDARIQAKLRSLGYAAGGTENESVSTHVNRGTVYARRGDLERAAAEYRKAIKADPRSPDGHNNLGHILCEMGQHDEALTCLQAALALEPNLAAVHGNLGRTYQLMGRPQDAIRHYHAAIEIETKDPKIYANIGRMYCELKEYDRAVECFRQSVALEPDMAKVHRALGRALARQDQWSAAIAEYRRAIDLEPDNARFHNELAFLFYTQKRYTDALVEWQQAVAINPNLHDAIANTASVHEIMGRPVDAIAQYKRLIALEPSNPVIHNALGKLHAKQKDYSLAITYYRKALALRPEFADAHSGLGAALAETGNLHGAINECRAATEMEPSTARYHNNLGWACHLAGSHAEAEQEFTKAVALDSDNMAYIARLRAARSAMQHSKSKVTTK